MALWGKTDADASEPKWLSADANNTNRSNDKDNVYFVDLTEAAVASNRAKGIKGPGWWLYHTSNGRHYAECLIPMKVSASDAGDQADDSVVADS